MIITRSPKQIHKHLRENHSPVLQMLKFFFSFNNLFDEGNEAEKMFLLEKLMAQESLPCLPVNWLRFSLFFVRVNREEVLEA